MNEVVYSGCNMFNQSCYYKEGAAAKGIILNNISNLLKNHSLDIYKSISYLEHLKEQIEESVYLLNCTEKGKTIIIYERFYK